MSASGPTLHVDRNGNWWVERPHATGSDVGPAGYARRGETLPEADVQVQVDYYTRAGFTIEDQRPAAKFLAMFPQTQRNYPTGGGCMAWLICADATGNCPYVLITHPDGGYQPELVDRVVGCGSYDDDGTWREENDTDALRPLTWAEAIEFVRKFLNDHARTLPARNELERVSGRRGVE